MYKNLGIYSNILLLNRQNLFLMSMQKSSNVDSIDSYINFLVNKKKVKWEEIKLSQKENHINIIDEQNFKISSGNFIKNLKNLHKPQLVIDVTNFNKNHIDNLFINSIETIDIENIKHVLNQCVIHNKISNDDVIIKLLDFLSTSGEHIFVEKIIGLCRNLNKQFYDSNFGFIFYLGKCYWIQGNVNLSLKYLEEAFRSGEVYKEKVTTALNHIISDTIEHKSEAVLKTVIELIEKLTKDYNDVNLLNSTWKYCFKSNWFSDQKIAIGLFEKYDQLRLKVSEQANIICYNLLTEHNVDAVHRLLELFLKFQMHVQCQNLLNLLFEYQYWRQDTRACTEIVKNSIDLNLELSSVCHQQFLHLLLRKPVVIRKQNLKIPKFKLQF